MPKRPSDPVRLEPYIRLVRLAHEAQGAAYGCGVDNPGTLRIVQSLRDAAEAILVAQGKAKGDNDGE